MRGRDTRKTLKELRHLCNANRIEVTVVHAKGSHLGVVFEDRKTGKKVRIVIAGHGEISAGVQRGALKYLADLATRDAHADAVRRILEAIFKD